MKFQDFELRPDARQLIVNGKPTQIGARAFDLLVALVERRERVVDKHELLDTVWPKVIVEENNLQVHIHTLRKLLGPSVITTVPGRGYRFTAAPVLVAAEPTPAASSPDAPTSQLSVQMIPAPEISTPTTLPYQVGQGSGDGNLPPFIAELFGREKDIRAVQDLLSVERLITITGTGGIGKTRLAQAVAHALRDNYPHGAWMIELAWVQDESMLANVVAQQLDLKLPGRRPALDELAEALRTRHLLLVLDNCEQLLDAVGALVFRLLRQAATVRILVTSQELLRIAGENVYKLSPLAVPSDRTLQQARQFGAVRLFVARATALDRRFELDERNIDAVVDICARLDGIALAIELAAARVPLLGVYGILDRLGERFRVLTGGARVSLRRHQTLRAALDWSHQLLAADEQKVFRRLGLFSDGFFVDAAQQIACDDEIDPWSVLDHLSALVDKSLVLVDTGKRPRYRLLETARVYAIERLAEAGETDSWLRRHGEVTLHLFNQAVKQRDVDWLWAELNNLRAAYQWAAGQGGDGQVALGLATSSAMVFAVGGMVGESLQRLLQVQPMVNDGTEPALAAQYWQWLGRCGIEGRLPTSQCVDALRRAETMFRELNNERHVHACLRMRAEALLANDDFPGAEEALMQAERMEHSGSKAADRLRRLRVLGMLHAAAGRPEESLAASRAAFDIADSARIERYVLIILADMARLHLKLGQSEQASQQYRSLAERAGRDPSQGLTLAHSLAGLTAALIDLSELREATKVGSQALGPLRRSAIFTAHCDTYAWLLARHQRHRVAARLLGAADVFHQTSETSRDEFKRRARAEVMRVLETSLSGDQITAWMAEGACATEETLAAWVEDELIIASVV